VQSNDSAESAALAFDTPIEVSRLRVFVNRLIFRGMLFTMGAIAVVMYRLIRDKNVTWRFAKAQARNLIRMCGVKVRIRGLEQLGAGPYMFTPNHQSHFDIAMLLGYLPGNNRFAAKKEMFAEPVLGAVLRTMGMIPIDRENPLEAIQLLNDLKLDQFSTIIFPEGTRSRDGNLLPFKKGPFVAAIHLGVPIVPVVCKGTTRVMPKGKYLSILPGEVEMIVLEPIATSALTYDDRDRLREQVRELIAAELKA
jgi:1-acyl-sn-glycerol-3-phosphate acyltransferase